MCITSIKNTECYKLVLKPKRECFVSEMPTADEIYKSLFKNIRYNTVWLSDMLLQNFLYKPLSLDTLEISDDDEYKIFKNIKAAKYIHTDIWDKDQRVLLQDIKSGEIVVDEDYIYSALDNRFSKPKVKIYPRYMNPIVYQFDKSTIFDVYIGSSAELKRNVCQSKALKISENIYEIVEIENLNQNIGDVFVLQADYKVNESFKIESDSSSVFRVRCEEECQYFKHGSVFDIKDSIDTNNTQVVYPYVIFRRK